MFRYDSRRWVKIEDKVRTNLNNGPTNDTLRSSFVNNILNQVIDFTVELETDGKNINVFICYDDAKWPLELSSGMERFLSSLALRIALIKITNLPKPDFIALDEGYGS